MSSAIGRGSFQRAVISYDKSSNREVISQRASGRVYIATCVGDDQADRDPSVRDGVPLLVVLDVAEHLRGVDLEFAKADARHGRLLEKMWCFQ